MKEERPEISFGGLSARLGYRTREKKGRHRRHSAYQAEVEVILQRIRSDAARWVMQVEQAIERMSVLDQYTRCVAIVRTYADEDDPDTAVPTKQAFCGEPAYWDAEVTHMDFQTREYRPGNVPLCKAHMRNLIRAIRNFDYEKEHEDIRKKVFNNFFFKFFEEKYGTRLARLVLTQFRSAVKKTYDNQAQFEEKEKHDVPGDGPEADDAV